MTTIIYKNGTLFSDTQGTNLVTGEISHVAKIHYYSDCVHAAAGYLGLAKIFLDKNFMDFLKYLPIIPCLDYLDLSDEGNTATIILADKKKVRVYHVDNIWKRGMFSLFRRKKLFEAKLEQDLVFSIGSGSTEEINKIAQQYSPEAAIKFASSVDKYTNDVITKLDIRELFGI